MKKGSLSKLLTVDEFARVEQEVGHEHPVDHHRPD